jgi:hypothetical protein
MEELLGWSLPGERPSGQATQKTAGPLSEQDNEMTMIQSRAEAVVPPPPFQPERPEPSLPESSSRIDDADQTMIMTRDPSPAPPGPAEAEPPMAETPEVSSAPITPATLEAAFPHLYAAPETLETPPSATPPAESQLSPALNGAISKEMAEALVSKIAKEIIEKVAWDVVPSLAEILIKEELDKLKSDKPS